MKIKVEDLRSPLTLTISGTEEWLAAIYESFPTPKGFESPRLRGTVTVIPDTYGSYGLKGQVSYDPYVDCSRCDAKIQWPIAQDFAVTFRREEDEAALKKERDLQREELDFYFYENNEIDLEAFLNEQVQMAIPMQTVRKDQHDQCLVCHRDLRDGLAYGSRSAATRENPFAVLKDLKVDED